MNDPDLAVTSPTVIVATDLPVEDPIDYDLSDQIEAGLQNRLELMQQTLRIDSAQAVVKAAENNVLPKLDATMQVGLMGLGFNFNDAVKSQGNTDFITYGLGFQFEVPIGNRQARAIYQRTLLQKQQSIDQWRLAAENVAQEVSVELKLSRQSDVAQAARQEVEAAISYNVALEALEKAKGTLLRYNNVVMKEEKGPMFLKMSV